MSVPTPTLSPNPWSRILDALEKKINRHSYDTWLKPTRYSHTSDGIMYIRVPTAEFRHVGDKYADLIQEALDNLNMDCHDVQFVTPEDDPVFHLLCLHREVHQRDDQLAALRQDDQFPRQVPQHGRAADRRHSVSGAEGTNPGRIFPYVQCAA